MNSRAVLSILLLLLLNACGPQLDVVSTVPIVEPTHVFSTVGPTLTPASTRIPTPTSPPVPPLVEHHWSPEPVLIGFGSYGGDGVGGRYPEFMLLGNGTVYEVELGPLVLLEDGITYAVDIGLFKTRLQRSEVCSLLNTIDQLGFFLYDPSVINYDLMGDGGGSDFIDVNAWANQHFYLSQLSGYIDGVEEDRFYIPPILPPIKSTYLLLEAFQPQNLQEVEWKNVLTVIEIDEARTGGVVQDWPSDLFSLGDFYDSSKCERYASRVISENEMRGLAQIEPLEIVTYVSEQGRYFAISTDWLFPEETFPSCSIDLYFSPEFVLPDLPETMSCFPEDGVLNLP